MLDPLGLPEAIPQAGRRAKGPGVDSPPLDAKCLFSWLIMGTPTPTYCEEEDSEDPR